MHEGHRQRMIERLNNAGEGLQEHELLEILLYNAIPRQNTNELAHRLIDSFGGLSGILETEPDLLMTVRGVGKETAAYLRVVSLLLTRLKDLPAREHADVSSYEKLFEFVRRRFGGREVEFIELYATDSRRRVTKSLYLTSHDTGKVQTDVSVVEKFLNESAPYGLMVAHNHLGNNSNPSPADDSFTRAVAVVCGLHNVRFEDHVIVGNVDIYSYALCGKLERIKRELDLGRLLGCRPQ